MTPQTATAHQEPEIWDDPDRARTTAELLKAMGHPARLRIIALLTRGEIHVNGIADRLGYTQSIVSQQLRILRMNSLVICDRRDGHTFYRLGMEGLRDLVSCVEGCG